MGGFGSANRGPIGRVFDGAIALAILYVGFGLLVILSVLWDWRVLPALFAAFFGFAYLKAGDNPVEKVLGACVLAALLVGWELTNPPDLTNPVVVQEEVGKLRSDIRTLLSGQEMSDYDRSSLTGDVKEALRDLAKTENAEAMYWYARVCHEISGYEFYCDGEPTAWMQQAASAGHVEAQYTFARIEVARLDADRRAIERNPSWAKSEKNQRRRYDRFVSAAQYFTMAANGGHPKAEAEVRELIAHYPEYGAKVSRAGED